MDKIDLTVEGTWSVDLKHDNGKTYFYTGWQKFVAENKLSVGDVCVFELMIELKCVRVKNFRTEDISTPSSSASQGNLEIIILVYFDFLFKFAYLDRCFCFFILRL